MYIIKSYLSAFAIFLIIDLIWLGFIAKDLYAKYLGFIMAKNINWTAAIIFYMIFVGGILFFVVNPAIEKNSLSYALLVERQIIALTNCITRSKYSYKIKIT